jgi:hypothetical protein
VSLGRELKISKRIGPAQLAPEIAGFPSPVKFPTHTPIVHCGFTPIAQASRCPKLVPVFQARGFWS